MTSSLSVVLLLGGAPPPPTLDLTLGSASVVAALTSGAADGMVLVERRLPPVLVPGTSTELQLQLGEVDLTLHADTETTDPVALEPGVAVALDVRGGGRPRGRREDVLLRRPGGRPLHGRRCLRPRGAAGAGGRPAR